MAPAHAGAGRPNRLFGVMVAFFEHPRWEARLTVTRSSYEPNQDARLLLLQDWILFSVTDPHKR